MNNCRHNQATNHEPCNDMKCPCDHCSEVAYRKYNAMFIAGAVGVGVFTIIALVLSALVH